MRFRPLDTRELVIDLFGRKAAGIHHRPFVYLIPHLPPAQRKTLIGVYCCPEGREAGLSRLSDWGRVLLGRAQDTLRELAGPRLPAI